MTIFENPTGHFMRVHLVGGESFTVQITKVLAEGFLVKFSTGMSGFIPGTSILYLEWEEDEQDRTL